MLRIARHIFGVAAFTLFISTAHSVVAVSPVPLQSAYWRFEEGPVGQAVPPGDNDYVKDSINANHMRAFDGGTTPDYTADVAPTPLKGGNANSMALGFSVHDDLYTDVTTTTKPIDYGMIDSTSAPDVHGFTIEAAFKPSATLSTFQALMGKEGQPNGSLNETLELKIRGDNHLLQIEQFDKAGNQVQVSSLNEMNVGQWYYTAVVNDGSTLSMYLDSNDGNGYVLQGTSPVSGALYQGPTGDDWNHTWSIGRGFYDGFPNDWFNGVIDEVRLSNSALQPWEFLFAPQGDYNGDKIVDAADYAVWRKTNVFGADGYTLWRNNFGKDYSVAGSGSLATSIPEPASLVIAAIALAGLAAVRRRNRQ
jgi:hypothetical protein